MPRQWLSRSTNQCTCLYKVGYSKGPKLCIHLNRNVPQTFCSQSNTIPLHAKKIKWLPYCRKAKTITLSDYRKKWERLQKPLGIEKHAKHIRVECLMSKRWRMSHRTGGNQFWGADHKCRDAFRTVPIYSQSRPQKSVRGKSWKCSMFHAWPQCLNAPGRHNKGTCQGQGRHKGRIP